MLKDGGDITFYSGSVRTGSRPAPDVVLEGLGCTLCGGHRVLVASELEL